MNTSKVIGLEGGTGGTWFKVLAEEGRGTTKYYPAVVDGIERNWTDFASLQDYLAHKVERERETIRFVVTGNAVAAEDAIAIVLGCKAIATTPTTVDAYPDQPLADAAAAASAFGRMGGKIVTPAKSAASRANGKLGGRPRKRKIVERLQIHDDGSKATIRYEDGSSETRQAGSDGHLNLADLWLVDAATGKLVQWGEEGLYETTEGWTRL